jgi:hypothetical protein
VNDDRWNEVVRTYEESLDLLEAAREEYAAAVKETMKELQEALAGRLSSLAIPSGVVLGVPTPDEDGGFAKHWLYCTVSIGGMEWAVVHAWVAAPYGGKPGTLRVGVEAKRYPEVLPWEQTWMRELAGALKSDLALSDIKALGREERFTEHWVWIANLDLAQPASATDAVGTFCRSLEAAAALSVRLAEEAEPVQRALGALKDLRRKLERKPIIRDSQLYPKAKDFEQRRDGASQLSIIHADLYTWVGVDPKERSVFYGHGFDDERFPGLIKQLAKRLGVKSSTRGDYPGAVLFDAASLRKAEAREITARGEEVFQAFVELTGKK